MKKRKKSVKIAGNSGFVFFNIMLVLIIAGSIVLSLMDILCQLIPWPCGFEDAIGVSTQIITSIASLVVSIVGIAISLQNEEFFGTKISRLYTLRVTKHYSILKIILLSIFLCFLNLVCYMLGLTLATLGTALATLCFLVYVICDEVPIMAKNEYALLSIIKDNLIRCYLNKQEVPKDLKDVIRYLLYRKNLKEIYIEFRDANDNSYNKYLLLKLLEFQHDLAFELNNQYDEKDQRIIASSMTENIFDIIFRHIDMSDEQYVDILNNKHLITRVLFRVNEIPSTRDILLSRISGLFQCLTFKSATKDETAEFLSTILIILASVTVKDGDFGILKGIRRQLSMSDYCLKEDTPALTVFTVLSMHLFYLCHSEDDTPQTIKEAILGFLSEKGMIEENTRIVSWKKLFETAASQFDVDYENFINLSLKNEHSLEYWLFGVGAKSIVLDQCYLATWYLTHLLNAHSRYIFNFSDIIVKNPNIKEPLKRFGETCFDQNGQFTPTEQMKTIARFYSDNDTIFSSFSIIENREHNLFNMVNNIKIETLRNDIELAMKINEKLLATKIQTGIEKAIQKEWGYSPALPIDDTERYFAVLLEKFPEAVNFEDSLVDFGRRSVLYDVEKAIPKTTIFNDDHFEESIRSLLAKKLKYCTQSAKTVIPKYFIQDPELLQCYVDTCKPLQEYNSSLLNHVSLVTDHGFQFNCEVTRVFFRPLSEEELAKQVSKHQRADGQYVFNGAFMPQEEITKMIRDKFTVLMITIRYKIASAKDDIFEIHPYSNGEKE